MWYIWGIFSLAIVSIAGQPLDYEEIVLPEVIVPIVPAVTISQGTVLGTYSEDGTYAQFYGIPYADSTSGSHRFKAPTPPPIFQDTFVADRKDIKCVRSLGVGYEGTEDCLVANVFTKSLDISTQLPVMVWVRGREFDKAYEYEPSFKNFVEQDVVIVSLNYRESVLGFLCLGTETAPGNAGLKDIIAGLRWVQDNIAQFGGNANNITLIGHGSGAAAVDLVTMSPMANGLVHKAIAQSGNALSPWAVTRDNLNYAIQVAEALGHVVTDIEELSNIFQRTSVAALMGVINELDLTDNSLAFSPCLERENLENVEPFMVKSPYQIIKDGQFLQIPFMTGYVDNEGTIRSKEAIEHNWVERMGESFSDFIQADLAFDDQQEQTEISQDIKSFYFRSDPIDMDHIDNYINYHGDTMILVSTLRETRLRAVSSAAPIYLYQFSYKGSLGESLAGPLEVESAAHSEELAYMFYSEIDDEVSERDRAIGDILIERWTNFAKTGVPVSDTSLTSWQPYTGTDPFYLRILDNEEINEQATFEVLLQNPHPDVILFWDHLYEEYFSDAEGKWDWIERNEDEDSEEAVTEEPETEQVTESGESAEVDQETEGGDENVDEEDVGNSASSAIGYTFSIIALFTILNKVHVSHILL